MLRHYLIFNKKVVRYNMKRILSERHKMGTYEKNKISLNCFDDKRFILDDEINNLAYFYKVIVDKY